MKSAIRGIPAAGIIAAVIVAFALSLVMWNNQRVLTYPDTMHYYQQALRFTGESEDVSGKAMDFVCGDLRRMDEISKAEKADCREYVGESWDFPDPYHAIFTARPLTRC
ncbi:hypothetical protein [Streptodolium elevatio]|uniref:DUF732 domain-containing protein n=1 Tax=Streptodolium elevatio TaxID=3157996 RepID=A0ABV3DW61_9ACTN